MATLANTYNWAADQGAVKAYLGITDASFDTVLELFYGSSIELGDLYLDNPFTDDDGVDVTHPISIRLGLYEFTNNMLEQRTSIKPGVGAIKEGDVQITYGFNLIRDYFQGALPPPVRRYWFPYKLGRRTRSDGTKRGSLMR